MENRANCARLTVLILDLSNCLTKTDPDTLKGMKREIEGVKSKMDECVELVKKFVGQKWWKRMLSAGSDADAFAEAHRDLDEVKGPGCCVETPSVTSKSHVCRRA